MSASQRIDLLLCRLRIVKSRGAGQRLVAGGMVRCNGIRVAKCSHAINAGDVLTLPSATGARVVAIDVLPTRRGPAAEARAQYRDLDPAAATGVATPQAVEETA